MALCDMILLAQPVSGSAYDLSSFGAMPQISALRASIGALGGIICAFFICFGFWHLKKIFEPVNQNLAWWLFVSLCSVQFFGGAFHAGYYFLSGEHGLNPDVLSGFTHHLQMLSWLGVPGYVVGTILFFRLASNSIFPPKLRFCNPLFIHAVILLIFTVLPAPVGGYLKPTFINVGFAIFFFSTLFGRA